jgi:hypothetical protein
MHHVFQSEADKARKAKEEALRNTVVFLGQFSSLINSRHFARWYSDSSSRFHWAGEQLDAKLRKDLMFQVRQGLEREEKTLSDIERIRVVAQRCSSLVEAVLAKDVIKVSKKEMQFRVPKGSDPAELIFAFLSNRDTVGMVKDLPNSFYVWNAISSLIIYARARETLVRSTGNAQFERILSDLDEEYLVNGYPHDLLAHDAHAFRTGVAIKALIIRNAYCSTFLVKEGQDIEPFEEGRLVQIKKAAKAA